MDISGGSDGNDDDVDHDGLTNCFCLGNSERIETIGDINSGCSGFDNVGDDFLCFGVDDRGSVSDDKNVSLGNSDDIVTIKDGNDRDNENTCDISIGIVVNDVIRICEDTVDIGNSDGVINSGRDAENIRVRHDDNCNVVCIAVDTGIVSGFFKVPDEKKDSEGRVLMVLVQ